MAIKNITSIPLVAIVRIEHTDFFQLHLMPLKGALKKDLKNIMRIFIISK